MAAYHGSWRSSTWPENCPRDQAPDRLVGWMQCPRTVAQFAMLALALSLVSAACSSGPAPSRSSRPKVSTASPLAHPALPRLHRQAALKFVHLHSASNPTAVVILEAARNLQPGQSGTVMAVRKVGNLTGTCRPGHPAVKFRIAYKGAGPPTVSEVRQPLAKPVSLSLLGPVPSASPVGGNQQFAFFQVEAGGESGDFSLALWATLTLVAGGCALSANGVLRVRCSGLPPSVEEPICSYLARRGASTHPG